MRPWPAIMAVALAVAAALVAPPLRTSAGSIAHYRFKLDTWSYFLALEDLGPGSSGLGTPLSEVNFPKWLAGGDNSLMLRIADYGDKDFEIDVLDAPPPDEDLSAWDHVAEANVRFRTGHIYSSTGESPPGDHELFFLAPGSYRARVYSGGTTSVYDWDADGLPEIMAVGGNDHYRVLLWPSDGHDSDTQVLKWLYCPAGQSPVFQPIVAGLAQALADRAGTPLDCGMIGPGGDVYQESSTGFFVHQVATGIPVLWGKDGRRWAPTDSGTVHWRTPDERLAVTGTGVPAWARGWTVATASQVEAASWVDAVRPYPRPVLVAPDGLEPFASYPLSGASAAIDRSRPTTAPDFPHGVAVAYVLEYGDLRVRTDGILLSGHPGRDFYDAQRTPTSVPVVVRGAAAIALTGSNGVRLDWYDLPTDMTYELTFYGPAAGPLSPQSAAALADKLTVLMH